VTPPALDRLVRKCLAKDPEARWQSAADLRDELEWIGETGPQAAAQPTSRRFGLNWLLATATLVLGAVAGVLWQVSRAPAAPQWTGVQLGGPSVGVGPRISPDGQLLAFRTMVDGSLQLAVMKPDTGSWTLLTRQRDLGNVMTCSWASDGSKLYFDRFWDRPHGVYSIPALGGEPRLLVENAWGPEALPDGSLIVAKLVEGGDYQLFHLWPESARLEALPAFVWRYGYHIGVRAFPDGKEILFQGSYTGEGDRSSNRRLYALDLATRRARILGPSLAVKEQFPPALAVTPDGKEALAFALRGDMRELVRLPRDGRKDYQVLLSLPMTTLPVYIDAGRDGSIYVDAWVRPWSILRYSTSGGPPEEIPVAVANGVSILPLAAGKFLFSATVAGRERVLAGQFGGEVHPLLQADEESTYPLTSVGTNQQVVLRVGPESQRRLAVASLGDGRILRRLKVDAEYIDSVAATPDGMVLFFVSRGAVWSVRTDRDAQPSRIAEGTSVCLDPAGRFLYISQTSKDPVAIQRMPVAGGPLEAIPVPPDIHLTPDNLSPTAVDSQGRILVETASANNSWYWGTAILDPARNSGTQVKVMYEGDTWNPGWTPDGRILAVGARFNSTIWRFSPPSSAKRK